MYNALKCPSMYFVYYLCLRFFISRPEDTARAFVRFECHLFNFPAVNNTRELAEKYISGTSGEVRLICPNSYNYSGNIIHFVITIK